MFRVAVVFKYKEIFNLGVQMRSSNIFLVALVGVGLAVSVAHGSSPSSRHSLLGLMVCTVPAQANGEETTQYTVLIDPGTMNGAILKATLIAGPDSDKVPTGYMLVPNATIVPDGKNFTATVLNSSIAGGLINKIQVAVARNVDSSTGHVRFTATIVDDEGAGADDTFKDVPCLGSNQD